jgi:hypothetical protein
LFLRFNLNFNMLIFHSYCDLLGWSFLYLIFLAIARRISSSDPHAFALGKTVMHALFSITCAFVTALLFRSMLAVCFPC